MPPFRNDAPMYNNFPPHHPQSTFNDPWDGSHSQLEWSAAIRQAAEQGLALPIRGPSSSYDAKEVEEEIHTANQRRIAITAGALSAFGIVPIEADLTNPTTIPEMPKLKGETRKRKPAPSREKRDFFKEMSGYPELFMEMARIMPICGLKLLYSISKDFHTAINGHLSHTLLRAADTQAPESASIFLFTFYSDFCIPDPAARPHPNPSKQEKAEVRIVPSLCWLEMVIHREKTIRDILACMARQGHRMPKGMSLSLKKMWLLMDIANSARRVQLMHSSFTDLDLYHIQMFIVKLDMRFNDPIDEPGASALRNLFF